MYAKVKFFEIVNACCIFVQYVEIVLNYFFYFYNREHLYILLGITVYWTVIIHIIQLDFSSIELLFFI